MGDTDLQRYFQTRGRSPSISVHENTHDDDDVESSICEPTEVQLHACAMLICQQQRYIDCLERTLKEGEGGVVHPPVPPDSPASPVQGLQRNQSYSAMSRPMSFTHDDPAVADASCVAYTSFLRLSTTQRSKGGSKGGSKPPSVREMNLNDTHSDVDVDVVESVTFMSRRSSMVEVRTPQLSTVESPKEGGGINASHHRRRAVRETHIAPSSLQPAPTVYLRSPDKEKKVTTMLFGSPLETELEVLEVDRHRSVSVVSTPAPQPLETAHTTLAPPFSSVRAEVVSVAGALPSERLRCYIRHPPVVAGGQYLYKGCVMALEEGSTESTEAAAAAAAAGLRVPGVSPQRAMVLTLRYNDGEKTAVSADVSGLQVFLFSPSFSSFSS